MFVVFYLQYELLFCIEDTFDPAINVVKTLMQKYPQIDSKLFTGMRAFIILRFEIIDTAVRSNKSAFKYDVKKIKLFVSCHTGGSNVGVNPKINNMQPGYEAAKYELVMISDSGIRSKSNATNLFEMYSVTHRHTRTHHFLD